MRWATTKAMEFCPLKIRLLHIQLAVFSTVRTYNFPGFSMISSFSKGVLTRNLASQIMIWGVIKSMLQWQRCLHQRLSLTTGISLTDVLILFYIQMVVCYVTRYILAAWEMCCNCISVFLMLTPHFCKSHNKLQILLVINGGSCAWVQQL